MDVGKMTYESEMAAEVNVQFVERSPILWDSSSAVQSLLRIPGRRVE